MFFSEHGGQTHRPTEAYPASVHREFSVVLWWFASVHRLQSDAAAETIITDIKSAVRTGTISFLMTTQPWINSNSVHLCYRYVLGLQLNSYPNEVELECELWFAKKSDVVFFTSSANFRTQTKFSVASMFKTAFSDNFHVSMNDCAPTFCLEYPPSPYLPSA